MRSIANLKCPRNRTSPKSVKVRLRTWKAVFFDPEHASVASFTGESGGDGLILHSPDLGAPDSRWSFINVRADSMVFRDEASDDGGKSWRLRSEYHLTRHSTGRSGR